MNYPNPVSTQAMCRIVCGYGGRRNLGCPEYRARLSQITGDIVPAWYRGENG
ncbi:MAG: hypothetical protein K8L91_03235 [Anaerolineae bacterium]|nr:hypothetical protein [Anaerolineae bacterium]